VPARPGRSEDAADRRGGVLVIDKPDGPTSHDIVAAVRRRLRGVKVGHTGTLDPFATGVLPLVIGRATRLARHLGGADKEYDATISLGRSTDTFDRTGRVVFTAPAGAPLPAAGAVASALDLFRGSWMQTPPAFSAKMSGGIRAYEQARRGGTVELAPVKVTVTDLELLSVDGPVVRVRLVASAGFYVRAFAQELGERLGTGGVLEGLRRLRSGAFTLQDAVTLDLLDQPELERRIRPLDLLLPEWPAVRLTAEGAEWAAHGRAIGPAQCRDGLAGALEAGDVRLIGPDGRLLATGSASPGGVLHPTVVLV